MTPAAVTVTVHINLQGQPLPPAAEGLVESLRALAGAGVTVVGGEIHPTGPQPAVPQPAVPQPAVPPEPAMRPAVTPQPAVPQPAVPPPALPHGAGRRPRLVRRAAEPAGGPAGAGPALRIHLSSRIVLRDGVPIRLTRREYDLLAFLCEHPRRVFGRGQLLRHVWGYDMVNGERTVDVHVRRLRAKLCERGPLIATVRGVGYRLDDAADVTVVSDDE
ncbi:MAG: hypothetical protein AUI14_21770 [Actinobacteria bacterium 13_2_20CM_2_71_6]|nr:MAG: hypothetical protein AUI14_21770 [Actinobacteria bacterium 13_2_20CM_2_71_6]